MKSIFIRLLGFVFILVALHRFFLKKDRLQELKVFGLPKYSDIIIMVFELIIGILLLLNVSYKTTVLKLFLLFFIVGCIIIFYKNDKQIMSTYNQIWTFQPTAMSFAMHLYIIFIVAILIWG
jgi:uncharacterized membrane protein YphA (DoxX/SURF4 family)